MIILYGRDWRRFLQMAGKIIANAQTISHILESYITRDNQGEPSETTGTTWKTVKESMKKIFGSIL